MTIAQVLERLTDGPKTYTQLKGLCGDLDYLLIRLLKSRDIVFVPCGMGAMYSLPSAPPQDKPAAFPRWKERQPDKRKTVKPIKKPQTDQRQCKACGVVKDKLEFPLHSNTFRYNTCRPCMLAARRARVANGGKW
jgi:hypothetical protein